MLTRFRFVCISFAVQKTKLTRILLNYSSMIQLRTKYILFFLMSFIYAISGFSQETTSEINGIITDTSGNGLAGATIEALHTPTGTKYATTSRKDGHYNLPNLRVGGPYTITISYIGYEPQTQENLNLLLGQAFVGDFKLSPTAQSLENVVVSSTRQNRVFNNNHTGAQEIISRNQIERLPTINRSLQDFTRLTPQANGLSFSGQSNQLNNITIDGANFNNSFGLSGTLGGQTNSQPVSLDAIEQIQVNLSPYDVRQGGFSGAGINTVTRSGTNQFKGSVYTYLRGPGMQGYKVGDVTIPKQDYSYNLRGATIGGPIIKNKLFFFISGEQERLTQPATSYVASNNSLAPDGTSISIANADTLNALRQFLIDKYGYDPGAYQNYSYKTQSDKLTAKIDWNINDNNTFTIKYNYLKSSRQTAASNSGSQFPTYGRAPGQYALPFNSTSYTINNNFNIVIAELNSRFGNKSSNKLQVGYTALRDYRASLSPNNFPLVDILKEGQPYTSFGYEQYTYGNLLNTDVFQVNDIFTFYKGSHEITVGTQNSFKKYENGFSPAYNGVYRYNSLSDFYGSAAGDTSVRVAQYDLSYTLNTNGSFPLVGPKDEEIGLFAQDKWRASKTFTLTYGLRVDIPIFQNTFLYNPVVDTLSQFYHGIHVNTGQAPKTNPLFSPRFGFTWDLSKGKQNSQLRGGLGLFAGPPPFVWISNQASNSGVALFGSIQAKNTNAYLFNPDVNSYKPDLDTLKGGLSSSYFINVTDPKFKFPQAFKSNLALDQKLPGNWIVTLEGTYTKNINSAFFQNINLPETGTQLAGPGGKFRYSNYRTYPIGGVGTVNNPSMSSAIYMTNVNKGYSYTLTVQVQKTWKNFYASAAYTYQQSKDIMVGGSTAATMWGSRPVSGNPNDPELGYSEGYLPHRVIASAFYRKEYAKHLATSIGLFFEGAPAGVGSYVYSSNGAPFFDINNDNFTNDLIYIPTNADIATYIANGQLEGSSSGDTRTPEQIGSQLNTFIDNSKYLRKHRGEIAHRNALVYPWFKRVDLNVTQDVYMKLGNNRHTLRFSLDITNIGNMINKNWGTYQTPTVTTPIKFDKTITGTDGLTYPVFSFPYSNSTAQLPYTSAFRDNTTSPLSRWQMQFGIRYLFN